VNPSVLKENLLYGTILTLVVSNSHGGRQPGVENQRKLHLTIDMI